MRDRTQGHDLEAAQRVVLRRVYKREGDNLIFDPATLDTPLGNVVDGEEAVMTMVNAIDAESRAIIEERLGQDMQDWLMGVRNQTLQVLLDWIFGARDGPLPRTVLKRLYAFARVISPDHVWRMSQTDLGHLFDETRAAVCEREKQEVEAFFRLWTLTKWTVAGGKSHGARERYAREKQGNLSRKGGKKVERLFGKKKKARSE